MPILLIPILLLGCGKEAVAPDSQKRIFSFDFADGEQGWVSLFTNYDVGREDFFELTEDYFGLPQPLDTASRALFISGNNHSDDLNMYFKYQVSGLKPNQAYQVAFEVTFATEVPTGCFGVGGSPGESVTVHAAAAAAEPAAIVDDASLPAYYRLNLVEAFPGNWYDATRIGNVANSRECEQGWFWEMKKLASNSDHSIVQTDSNGKAWLLVGTRSGFEATSRLYYTEIVAEFTAK